MSATTTIVASPETKLRERIAASLQDADAKTLGYVQALLTSGLASGKKDGRVVVVASIPHELAGRDIVFAGRAPDTEGELMRFATKPVNAAGASIFLNLATMPSEPIAIGLSDTSTNGVALYSLTAQGSTVATAPDSARPFVNAVMGAAIDLGTRDAGRASHVADTKRETRHASHNVDAERGTAISSDLETQLRGDIASFRQRTFEDGLSTSTVGRNLRVGDEAIRMRRKKKQVLGIKLNGDYRYPKWQFDFNRADGMVPGVLKILEVTNLDGLELAAWFESPQPELDGMTPVEALHANQQEEVVALAAAAGAV